MKDIIIENIKHPNDAASAQVVAEDVLEQLGYTWDYTETSPDCKMVIIKNVRKE